jgi:ADP-ribosylglycohydrolase
MNQSLPKNYEEKVYAGWLGKCIGVRFGAPLENWTYQEIQDNLGELTTYVREDQHKIFKPDDDTAVPMILIRALEDYGATMDITPQQIADTLVNYIADQHGSFWWGGYGISTEHTTYLNLVNGIPAPRSGSIAQNGAAMAEQIGGQIFSDIWGLIAPNNPTLAANISEKASSVTHDGNGIYGGRFIAAMVSAAFSEIKYDQLLTIGLKQIPNDSEYARVIQAMIDFHTENPDNWRAAFSHLKANFGYDRYPGEVHIIPNAGVIAIGLLYGGGDFSKTLQITNMAGWDTDCNVGNVGTIMGVLCGLDSIDSHWRDPMNDLLITANLIGTRNILTIPQCTDLFVHLGRQLANMPTEDSPRYHFRYRGSTQNYEARGNRGRPIHLMQADIDDVPVLRTAIRKLNKKGEIRIFTRTYYHPNELSSNYYGAAFTPLIYSGQTITTKVYLPADAPSSIRAGLYAYDENHDQSYQAVGEEMIPGNWHTLTYTILPLKDACISEVGVVLRNTGDLWSAGSFSIESLDWSGTPNFKATFEYAKPESGAISQWTYLRGYWRLEDRAYHGSSVGEGETYTGDIIWSDYSVSTEITPLIGDHHNVLFRVQGALRNYAFGLAPDNTIKLYKKNRDYQVVQSTELQWEHGQRYQLSVSVDGNKFDATVEGSGVSATLSWVDDTPLLNGQIGLGTWYGSHTAYHSLEVSSVEK